MALSPVKKNWALKWDTVVSNDLTDSYYYIIKYYGQWVSLINYSKKLFK